MALRQAELPERERYFSQRVVMATRHTSHWIRAPVRRDADMVRATQLTRGQRTRMMYIELKSGHRDNGPAWIGRVTFSKSGRSIFYKGRELTRIKGGVPGNYMDVQTREEFWVSGVKRNGSNRHWAGSGPVQIDDDVRVEYEALIAR